MKNLIVANWKMNPNSLEEAKDIFDGIKNGVAGAKSEVIVCPPFVFLAELKGLTLGAQNVFYEEKGVLTGEISAVMLKDLGVEYVIIGHSDSRKHLGETDEIINKKVKKALEDGLKVIFCIGETAEERDAGKKNEVLEMQIRHGLDGISNFKFQISNLVVAYEPVWAIGTGKACGVEDAKKMKEFIEKVILNMFSQDMAKGVKILYGGSVNSQNSAGYIKSAGYNGLLVGGASLNPEEFIKIVKSAE